MTNAVVWRVPGTDEVWAVADSRVTTGSAPGQSPRRVTDQAMKVLVLKVVCHGETKYSPWLHPVIEFDIGMVYAGAVLPAMMTHAAAAMMVGNLHPQLAGPEIRPPRFSAIAELVRHLSEVYTKEAAFAYRIDMPPLCEFVIFALPPTDELNAEPLSAYWIHPRSWDPNVRFEQVVEPVDIENGEMAVIGTDRDALRAEIERLRQRPSPAWKGVEPRIALERRMRAGTHDTVGGTLQFGILDRGDFKFYGSMVDGTGTVIQNWLGFDCQNEIRDILKIPVLIPALR